MVYSTNLLIAVKTVALMVQPVVHLSVTFCTVANQYVIVSCFLQWFAHNLQHNILASISVEYCIILQVM